MSQKQLKNLFENQSQYSDDEQDKLKDSLTCLYFTYAQKKYCAGISEVREIIEFPLFVPYPVDVGCALGVFNLRGNVVSIMDPRRHYVQLMKTKGMKAQEYFSREKLRLILFELEGEVVALPVYDVGKAVVDLALFEKESDFVPIDTVPYEKFNTQSLNKGGHL